MLEKGWIGGGNTGRNTTIVRSNYHLDANAHFYELSLKLWEGLAQDLNFNVMFSPRGVLNLVHSPADMDAAIAARQRDAAERHRRAIPDHGRDRAVDSRARLLADARFPILGGLLQPRGGTARHDAVAWGYARAADARGVDIIQHCEVTGFRDRARRASPASTPRRDSSPRRSSGSRSPGNSASSPRWPACGCRSRRMCCRRWCPSRVKPVLDTVVTSGAVHFYISQSDKGELVMGGDLDFYNSYAQRGNLPVIEHVVRRLPRAVPELRAAALMRTWGGVTGHDDGRQPDHRQARRSRASTMTAAGATAASRRRPRPAACSRTRSRADEPHPLNAAFTLERFAAGPRRSTRRARAPSRGPIDVHERRACC